jgi:hypothetical protein
MSNNTLSPSDKNVLNGLLKSIEDSIVLLQKMPQSTLVKQQLGSAKKRHQSVNEMLSTGKVFSIYEPVD